MIDEEVQVQPFLGVDVHRRAANRLKHLRLPEERAGVLEAAAREVVAVHVLPLLRDGERGVVHGGQSGFQRIRQRLDFLAARARNVHRVASAHFADADGQQVQRHHADHVAARAGGGLELGNVQLQDALGALPQHGFLMPGDAQRERARLAAATNRLPYARHLPGVRHGDDQRALRRIAEVLLLVVARQINRRHDFRADLGVLLERGLHRQQRGIAVTAAGQHNALDIEDFRRGEDGARLWLQVGVLLSHQLRQAHDLAAKGAVEIHLVHA